MGKCVAVIAVLWRCRDAPVHTVPWPEEQAGRSGTRRLHTGPPPSVCSARPGGGRAGETPLHTQGRAGAALPHVHTHRDVTLRHPLAVPGSTLPVVPKLRGSSPDGEGWLPRGSSADLPRGVETPSTQEGVTPPTDPGPTTRDRRRIRSRRKLRSLPSWEQPTGRSPQHPRAAGDRERVVHRLSLIHI